MKTPYGLRGEICSKFGWTYDYLVEGIGWMTVEKMLMDMPIYETESRGDGESNGDEIDMTMMSNDDLEMELRSFIPMQ